MKVLHVIPCLAGGGAERQLQYLNNSVAMSDLEMHVAYLNDGGVNIDEYGNVNLHKLKARSNYDPGLIVRLYLLIRRIDPHLVQSWLIHSDILSAIVCILSRKKWVARESNAPGLRSGGRLKFLLRKFLFRFTSGIISNSLGGYRYWNKTYPRNRNILIENGFPTQDIERESSKELPSALLDSLGDYVVFVGRLENQKNISRIIESMALVSGELKLVICGEGKLSQSLKDLAVDIGVEKRILFKGRTEKNTVYQLMRNARGVVLMSHFEGFPNVAVEAMVCHSPLVLSDIEPHRSILSDDSAAFVNKEDPKEIALAIDGLVNNSDLASCRSEKAYRISQDLSLDAMAQKYRRFYLGLE